MLIVILYQQYDVRLLLYLYLLTIYFTSLLMMSGLTSHESRAGGSRDRNETARVQAELRLPLLRRCAEFGSSRNVERDGPRELRLDDDHHRHTEGWYQYRP